MALDANGNPIPDVDGNKETVANHTGHELTISFVDIGKETPTVTNESKEVPNEAAAAGHGIERKKDSIGLAACAELPITLEFAFATGPKVHKKHSKKNRTCLIDEERVKAKGEAASIPCADKKGCLANTKTKNSSRVLVDKEVTCSAEDGLDRPVGNKEAISNAKPQRKNLSKQQHPSGPPLSYGRRGLNL